MDDPPSRPRQAAVRRIRLPAVDDSPPGNAWLITTRPITLIDPGPATAGAYAALRDGLAGFELSIRDVRRVILTHGHAGHAGLAARVHADCGARVLGHPLALAAAAAPHESAELRVSTWLRAAQAAGVPTSSAEVAGRRWRSALLARLALSPTALPPSAGAAVADGERLAGEPGAGGGDAWTVRDSRGHSPDHLVLIGEGLGIALTGDLIDRRAPTVPALAPSLPDGRRHPHLADVIATWRTLARQALPVWLPGHGDAVRAPRVLVARRLAEERAELHRVKGALAAAPVTAWALAATLGLDVAPERLVRTLALLIGRLDWLVDRGLAERRVVDGTWRFSLPGRTAAAPGRGGRRG